MASPEDTDNEKKDETEASEKSEGIPEPEATAADAPEKPMAVGAEGEEILIAEPDRVNVGIIGAVTLAIVVATVAVVVGVQQFFAQTIRGEVNTKVYEPEDPQKKDLALVEQSKLTKYQWVNQKDGIVRIPKERARELVLAEYAKLPAYQPGVAPAPAPVPEPGPAPSTTVEPSTSASVAPSASVVPGAPSGTPAPTGSVAPEASTLKPGMAPSASASVPHKH